MPPTARATPDRQDGRDATTALGRVLALVVCIMVAGATAAPAQDGSCEPGDLEVHSVRFVGNRRFRAAELSSAIATTPSSWLRRVGLPFGTRRCLDTLELQRDVIRLRYYYRQRGFYDTAVDTTLRRSGHDMVTVTFRIAEGPPVIIDSVVITGLDTVRNGPDLARPLFAMKRRVYDRIALQTIVDTIVEQLHNDGYARAALPLRNDSVSLATNRAWVRRDFLPGRIARVGEIRLELEPADSVTPVQIPERVVRRLLSVHPGDVYRERDLYQSQRNLYVLDAYQHVEISPAPDSLQPKGDSLLIVIAHLHERDMHSIRLGAGWASLDCFRTQVRYTDRDFLGGARRLELTGRVSKIGRGYPLGGADQLCPTIQGDRDPFSDTLNYYVGAALRQPTLFGPRNVPTLTLYSERRSEFQAYQRTTPFGGVASVTRELQPRTPFIVAYQIEYGRTDASDALFCAIFNVCDFADIATLKRPNRLAVLSAGITRDRTDNPGDPSRGDVVRLEVRHASPAVGSDPGLQFNKWIGEGSLYRRVGANTVAAVRLLAGGVLASGSLQGAERFVPPQERLYGGGPNSVRGYNQNELGPITYIVDSAFTTAPGGGQVFNGYQVLRASPTGGNALVVTNIELRIRSVLWPDLLEWVPFLDGGAVYNRRGAETIRLDEFRWTPGLGLRVASPVGPIRLDVAYNGYLRRAGAAFVLGKETLTCVSPGATGSLASGQDCPATFAPPPRRTFFERLVFHFSIGQAF